MVKDDKDVIAEFNEYVNMTPSELEKWLKSDESSEAGWRKDGGDGKSVGQDSGEKIIEILKANPKKDPEKYTEEQIQHMRKVASYCKRHLAQESGSLEEKDPEDAKKTKSYISLKNWGHDPLKAQGKSESTGKNGSKSGSKKKGEEEEDDAQEEQEENGEEEEQDAEEAEKKAGDKRKKSGQQNGANKKRETRQGAASKRNGEGEADQKEEDDEGGEENGEEEEEEDGDDDSGGKKSSKNGPKKGEKVSWNWGSGNPTGKVLDVKEDEATITTKRGNEVSRKGDPEDPAVILDTGKSKAIKSAHELN
ncbi:hypothetical protein J7T55_010272 [Diaporthe amygdali]|uniref:uncharacterized protein n=1 Tax=Phomopsis amygdali TaxID=1214568 RepID=UPI0022FE50FE|nr:uncharacterized protein J7T55_010272 [Diaporthe amygdali]KAJ0107667.1 hypothetical protein J7T55_010272 [Diaporthe amygdali]